MILVFAGAGGSAAVDPEQYPTTVEFFSRLPDNIKEAPLFIQICEFLEIQKDEQPIDIEEILWTLDELAILRRRCLSVCDPEKIFGWLLHGRMSGILGEANNIIAPFQHQMYDSGWNQIENLKDDINALVYDLYATPPDKDKLSNWVQLLQGLVQYDSNIEIFTTNYDRVLEQVIDVGKINLETGLKSNVDSLILDTSIWDTPGVPYNNHGRLTKLHGSVNWQRSNEGIIISNPIFTGNHQQHLILYPGYKGEPVEEPFVQFHEHLRAVVQQASAAIFIGYAFRDDYINTILSELPSEIPKFVINKDDALPDFSFLDECQHLKNGLTEESVNIFPVSLLAELE